MKLYQYYCTTCLYSRPGLLDRPSGIGGYAWSCPECKSTNKSGMIWSYEVLV